MKNRVIAAAGAAMLSLGAVACEEGAAGDGTGDPGAADDDDTGY